MTVANMAHGPADHAEAPDALLLPALSSVATREEMRPLAERLGPHLRCRLLDWPGFGGARSESLVPAVLDAFLDELLEEAVRPVVGIAAGHGATYLARAARRRPGAFAGLVLVAPTWRGPLPTMTRGRRPALCRRVRTVLEAPLLGPVLFRLNVSGPVVRMMLRGHVYADPATLTAARVGAKLAVAHRGGGRFGTAAFVSGGLDPVTTRADFLALFEDPLPPTVLLRPRAAPKRSAAEMDALTASGRVRTVAVPGALAAHEEYPDAVAAAILSGIQAFSGAA